MAFSELLARSAFSFLSGASLPEEMVEGAQRLGIDGLGLCDRDGLYGSVRAFQAAKKLGQRLIVGCEFTLADVGQAVPRLNDPLERTSPTWQKRLHSQKCPTVCLLVRDADGYTELCSLITLAHSGLPKGVARLEPSMLRRHHTGVACAGLECTGLTCIVPVPEREVAERLEPWLAVFAEQFRGCFYIGVYRRLDGLDDWREEWARRVSAAYGAPIVASSYPLFHEAARKPLADIVQCIRESMTLQEAGCSLSSNAEARLRSEKEMLQWFAHEPEWVHRTSEVASELTFCLSEIRYQFPCTLEPGETASERLERLTWQGAHQRYEGKIPDKVTAQINKELQLIDKINVAAYFLCTKEIVEIARRRKILCQGRGSAANSAVCYVLGITAVDPAQSNLLFERFLSAERNEPPDIDIDFEHERREEVIQEIYERYGRDHAAMVAEVSTYRGKSALREVGKVFGLSPEQLSHLSSMVSHWDGPNVTKEDLRRYGFDDRDERLLLVIRWAQVLAGFPRHMSVHVGGFVLSKTPLMGVTSVEPATMPGRTVVPWDKDDIDVLGFFKVDVLGLGMLTAIRKALALIYEEGLLRSGDTSRQPRTGKEKSSFAEPAEEFVPLDVVTRIPKEDKAVYKMISEADTVGVFQIESRAQMAMLPRLRPQSYYDLVIEVAIVRPGPIQGGMVHPYLRRRNREEAITMPHPELQPILQRTLGVPLFQEQVMEISITGAGYTGGEADQLRRDMAAWKKSGKLLRHKQRLLDGFAKKGISPEFGEALFEQIKGFGDYGFPESHAASFAILVYLSAWQKAHFPAHFTCAVLNSQPMGFYSPSSLVKDAQKHGVEVRPVDVTVSFWDHTLEPASKACRIKSVYPEASRALRLGLRLVKGFREQAAQNLVAARSARPFEDLADLVRRSRLNKDEVQILAETGALESLIQGRRQALWAARAPRIAGLFADVTWQEPDVKLPPLSATEQLDLDYQHVGLSVSDHPMRHWRPKLRKAGVVTAAMLGAMARSKAPTPPRVQVAGVVLSRQRPATASGVVFLTLEDETGTINVVLFSKVFEEFSLAARHASFLLVQGKFEAHTTYPKSPDEVGDPTPTIHVIAERLVRLPGGRLPSRNFH
jgi:error-prone DNA polymerase